MWPHLHGCPQETGRTWGQRRPGRYCGQTGFPPQESSRCPSKLQLGVGDLGNTVLSLPLTRAWRWGAERGRPNVGPREGPKFRSPDQSRCTPQTVVLRLAGWGRPRLTPEDRPPASCTRLQDGRVRAGHLGTQSRLQTGHGDASHPNLTGTLSSSVTKLGRMRHTWERCAVSGTCPAGKLRSPACSLTGTTPRSPFLTPLSLLPGSFAVLVSFSTLCESFDHHPPPHPTPRPGAWALAYLSRETAPSMKLLAFMVRKMRKCTALQSSERNTQPCRV